MRTYDLGFAASPCGLLRKQYGRLRLPSNADHTAAPIRRRDQPFRLVYHLAIKPISRSDGRSATAAAAYRSGSLLIDERTGEVHDYTRKGDVEHSEILVPAGSPIWATERVALWNAAEAAEKRKDARVARDYEVAIPKELTREQGIALVRDFAHRLVDAYGVAVDFNIHRDELRGWDGSEKGWQGYHAHLLTSTRRLGRDGFGEKAAIELSDTKRKSLGLSDGAAEIARVRQWWEIDANRHLEQAGQAQRIDRRSLKDQGIDREPTVHLGPAVTLLERGGVPSRLGDINRQVVAEHQVSLERQRQVVAMAVEIGELYGEIVGGRGRRAGGEPVEPAVQEPERERGESSRRSGARRLDPEDRAVSRQALADLVRERDLRVQRVLARAQARQQRRNRDYQALDKAEPAAPKGLLATFQQKGYRQAHAVWERTTQAAARLVEQARWLTQQLMEAKGARRLVAWARDALKAKGPQVEKSGQPGPVPAERAATVRAAEQQVDRKERAAPEPRRQHQEAQPTHQPSPTASPAKDLQSQAAEGVAALRERMKQRRQLQPDRAESEKLKAEQEFERLRAIVQAQRDNGTAVPRKAQEAEQQQPKPRDKSRDGPGWG